jgi:molybdopterin converting factor small subunit
MSHVAARAVDPVVSPAPGSVSVAVTVRYFAAARAAASVEEERVTAGPTVGEVLDAVRAAHDEELRRVLSRCSYLVDGIAVHGTETPLRDGAVLDVLPPFAGG